MRPKAPAGRREAPACESSAITDVLFQPPCDQLDSHWEPLTDKSYLPQCHGNRLSRQPVPGARTSHRHGQRPGNMHTEALGTGLTLWPGAGLGSGGQGPRRLAAAPGSHLHATDPDAQRGRRALLALAHLPGSLLGGRVVAVLPGAHLQVQHARALEVVHHVLQQQELCARSREPHSRRHLPAHGAPQHRLLSHPTAHALASVAPWQSVARTPKALRIDS